jgi:ATP-binding cassette subfamily F protein 3
MLFPRNVLALDEPTNHLDIPAREALEEALLAFEGTLMVVSHDRYFLDKVCSRLLVIEGDSLEAHLGNWSDYRARQKEQARAARPPEPVRAVVAAPPPADAARSAGKERERHRRRLEKKVETLEAEVGKLEAELATLRADLAGDHQGDWQKLHTLADRERDVGELLTRRMAEWESAAAALAADK